MTEETPIRPKRHYQRAHVCAGRGGHCRYCGEQLARDDDEVEVDE